MLKVESPGSASHQPVKKAGGSAQNDISLRFEELKRIAVTVESYAEVRCNQNRILKMGISFLYKKVYPITSNEMLHTDFENETHHKASLCRLFAITMKEAKQHRFK